MASIHRLLFLLAVTPCASGFAETQLATRDSGDTRFSVVTRGPESDCSGKCPPTAEIRGPGGKIDVPLSTNTDDNPNFAITSSGPPVVLLNEFFRESGTGFVRAFAFDENDRPYVAFELKRPITLSNVHTDVCVKFKACFDLKLDAKFNESSGAMPVLELQRYGNMMGNPFSENMRLNFNPSRKQYFLHTHVKDGVQVFPEP